VLLVAATDLELPRLEVVETLVCGIGPVEAAVATAAALAGARHRAVVNIGIAGARGLEPGALVLGSEAIYCDLVDPASLLPRVDRMRPDPALLAAATDALPEAHLRAIATTARVGDGAVHADVEAMEGFAVLRAAAVAGVPALELRAISNGFGDDRSTWRREEAIAALGRAVERLLAVLDA
jgi:predicted 5'-methylthioadenosine/S-adenosylhomocysteine nucleosidase